MNKKRKLILAAKKKIILGKPGVKTQSVLDNLENELRSHRVEYDQLKPICTGSVSDGGKSKKKKGGKSKKKKVGKSKFTGGAKMCQPNKKNLSNNKTKKKAKK